MGLEKVSQKLRAIRERAGLSRQELATLAGFTRGTSLARYESDSYMGDAKLSVELVAKVAPALIGRGVPPITAAEVWELAEAKSTLIMAPSPVVVIPVIEWGQLMGALANAKTLESSGSIEIVGIPAGSYLAARVMDAHAERIAPKGSIVVISTAECELRDGRRFVIALNDAPVIRRYFANPPRFESEAITPEPTAFHREAVAVIGRVTRVINEL